MILYFLKILAGDINSLNLLAFELRLPRRFKSQCSDYYKYSENKLIIPGMGPLLHLRYRRDHAHFHDVLQFP